MSLSKMIKDKLVILLAGYIQVTEWMMVWDYMCSSHVLNMVGAMTKRLELKHYKNSRDFKVFMMPPE